MNTTRGSRNKLSSIMLRSLYLHIMGVLHTASYKMKRLPRQYDFKSIALLCIIGICLIMSFSPVEAQTTTAKDLLAEKEAELNMFVDAVERNSGDCDVMNGCSSECSRPVCYEYGIPGDPTYQCLGVTNNTNPCDTTPCTQRNFDFSRSFIRSVDPFESHIARTVCTHRSLDAHFKNSSIANSSHLFRVYFGAVDGTWRLYPGADEPCDNEFDNRIRPWYLESIYVPKVVTVLIDSGIYMRDPVIGSDQETYIKRGVTTALMLLKTLENTDWVTCISFDGEEIKTVLNATVYNATGVDQFLNESLKGMVENGSKSNPDAAHTNAAINFAMGQLTDSKTFPTSYLKVVVAFIGGLQYQNISELNVTQIPNVNLFIYSFRGTGNGTGIAPQCIPALRAYFQEIPIERLNNPLYALLSYYSFLGKLHRSYTKNVTNFGTQYKDYSGIDDYTLTLSKAAFGPNGELLGVVGLDFFQRKMESYSNDMWDSIKDEAAKHDRGQFDTSTDLSIIVCFNQTDPCPGLDSADVQGSLCPNISDDAKIGCCGTCRVSSVPVPAPMPVPVPAPEHHHVQLKPWMIALIVVAVVLLCCFGVCVCVVHIRRRTPRSKPPSITKYPGAQVPGR